MVHTVNVPPENLPAARTAPETAVEPVRPQAPPSVVHDLVRTIAEASTAVKYLDALGSSSSSDVTVSAFTVLECAGSSPADALQAATDVARGAPALEIHSLAWARVPGPVEGAWEWRITMTVSSRDPQTGECAGSAHIADRRR